MKIKSIKVYKKDLQLTKPYTVAYTTTSHVENAFVEVVLENGIVGLGCASPSTFVINEAMEATLANLQSKVIQKWVGQDIRQFRAIIHTANNLFPLHSATRCAIDIAMHDAFGKYLGIPILAFYGGKIRPVPTSVTIGISSVEKTLREAKEYRSAGFKILKIKTGNNLLEDIERCTKLREHHGDYFKIRVDANQGYTAQQTIDFVNFTKKLGLELVEQPMPAGSEEEMRMLPTEIRKIIACDESLHHVKSAIDLVAEPKACGIFNIKLMKCGGLLGAFEIATVAKAAGIDLFWGCFDESIISITAALHAALACPSTKYIDLDGSLDLAIDVAKGGFKIVDGELIALPLPGFGCELI